MRLRNSDVSVKNNPALEKATVSLITKLELPRTMRRPGINSSNTYIGIVLMDIVRGSSSFVINADSCIVKVQGFIYFTLTCRISPPHLTSSGRYSF